MNRPIRLHPQAQMEFDDAIEWYERERRGLGHAFVLRVNEVLNRIRRTPEIHGRVFEDVRCTRVHRFPYSVYYRIQKDWIEVLSVFHAKRDPRDWQSRV